MRLGVFAKTFAGDIETNMAAVAAAGIGAVQYNFSIAGLPTVPEEVPEAILARIRAAADIHQVELSAISGTFNIAHPDPQVRAAGLRAFPALAGAAAQLGIPVVTLSSGTRNPDNMWQTHPENTTEQAWTDSAESLAQLAELASAAGILVAFEPEHSNIVSTAAQARTMLEQIGSASLRIVFDAANLIDVDHLDPQTVRETIRTSAETLAGDIALAHAKELLPDRSPAAPGQGVLPWADVVEALTTAGYDGPLVMHGLAAEAVPTGRSTLAPLLTAGA